jgi:hypothetical protein
MTYNFRKLQLQESLKYGFYNNRARRKEDGSNQWQDGPNPDVIQNDIDQNHICFD